MSKIKTILAPVTLAALATLGALTLTAHTAQAGGRHGIAVGEPNPGTPRVGRRFPSFHYLYGGFGYAPVYVANSFAYGYDDCLIVRRVFVRGFGFVTRKIRLC